MKNPSPGLESPLLLKEGEGPNAGVVVNEPRSAPTKERFAGISCGFASLENHPDSLREPPLLQKEGSCCPTTRAAVFANWTALFRALLLLLLACGSLRAQEYAQRGF